MKKYNEINKETLSEIRKDLKDLFKKYEEETGVHLEFNNISYSSATQSFTTKLEGTLLLESDNSVEEKIFKNTLQQHPFLFEGIFDTDFGKEFEYNGEMFKLVGLKPTAKKYPILCEKVSTGQVYKFTKSMILEKIIH